VPNLEKKTIAKKERSRLEGKSNRGGEKRSEARSTKKPKQEDSYQTSEEVMKEGGTKEENPHSGTCKSPGLRRKDRQERGLQRRGPKKRG